MIKRLAIIGVGLIGGSLAMALRKQGVVDEIVGCGRSNENLTQAVKLGVIDRFTHDVSEAVSGADMVFVAVPIGAMPAIFSDMREALASNAVITDAGSSKGSVVAAAIAAFGELPDNFVPGHPIAGTEESGVEAAFSTLYQQRRVILTPTETTAAAAVNRVREMWQHCGASVSLMDVEHHDEVLAATSHLPHMLAFGLVDSLARMEQHDEIFRYAAGGFRDFTRIASSNPVMWRDICLSNKTALLKKLDQFAGEMGELAAAIEQDDGEQLLEIFTRAKAARDSYIDTAANDDDRE